MQNKNRDIDDIYKRLDKLEKAVFGKKGENITTPSVKKKEGFVGAKGGCQLLISKNYFTKKHKASEVREQLISLNYHYNIQVVQTTLNRLSKKSGPLLSLKESGIKHYVIRK